MPVMTKSIELFALLVTIVAVTRRQEPSQSSDASQSPGRILNQRNVAQLRERVSHIDRDGALMVRLVLTDNGAWPGMDFQKREVEVERGARGASKRDIGGGVLRARRLDNDAKAALSATVTLPEAEEPCP